MGKSHLSVYQIMMVCVCFFLIGSSLLFGFGILQLLGRPNDKIWPGWSDLPAVKKVREGAACSLIIWWG